MPPSHVTKFFHVRHDSFPCDMTPQFAVCCRCSVLQLQCVAVAVCYNCSVLRLQCTAVAVT